MAVEVFGQENEVLLLKDIYNRPALPVGEVDIVIICSPLFPLFHIETGIGMEFVDTYGFRELCRGFYLYGIEYGPDRALAQLV